MTAGPDREEEVAMPDSTTTPGAPACAACGEPPSAPAPGAAEAAEPITHCEWCGAEYPVPSEK